MWLSLSMYIHTDMLTICVYSSVEPRPTRRTCVGFNEVVVLAGNEVAVRRLHGTGVMVTWCPKMYGMGKPWENHGKTIGKP